MLIRRGGRFAEGSFYSDVSRSMARSEVITLSPAGAEIPGQRCEAPISIPADPELLKQQRYDDALRSCCDTLSAQDIQNFIHYGNDDSRLVELFDPPGLFVPFINHTASSIELREHDLCDTR